MKADKRMAAPDYLFTRGPSAAAPTPTSHFHGQRVATKKDGVVYFLAGDHLGTDYRWTGQRQEESLGLYQMGARFYDPALGRWLSADTIVPGTAASSGGGAATLGYDDQVRLTPLTVGFHETQFRAVVGEENCEVAARGFWFRRREEEKWRSRYQGGRPTRRH